MKIAVVASSFIPSNAANSIQVMKVCQALIQAGSEVQLWVPLSAGQDRTPEADWQSIKSFYGISTSFPIHWVQENLHLKRYDFTWKVMREMRQWRPDLLYTWMPQAAYLGLLYHLPVALELHMMPTGKLGPWLLKMAAQTQGKKLFLPITKALREKLSAVHGIKFLDEEVCIAPMGSEPERYHALPDAEECRRQLGLPNRLTAAYTGHLYPGRGMALLVELAKYFPQAQFLWIGGREEDVLPWRKQIEAEGIQNVILSGFLHNAILPQYQAAAEILLMPYGKNVGVSGTGDTADVCSPMKLFDYLSAGRAILSSDLPVIHEILNDTNAIFAIPDDINSWKEGLMRLLDDPELRERLAAAAKICAEQYTWLRRAQQVIHYFELTDD